MNITAEVQNQCVAALWYALSRCDGLFILLQNSLPYLREPENVPQGDYLAENEREAVMFAFINLEAAKMFGNMLVEMDETLRPSEFTFKKFTKEETFSFIDEMSELAAGQFDAGLRIDLVEQITDDTLLTDLLYSTYVSKH